MLDKRFAVSVHIMTSLALSQQKLTTSEYLAGSVGTNAAVVRRLLAQLVKAGLVKGHKGKNGGVELARTAEKINMRDIYCASTSGTLVACNDSPPLKACPISCSMVKIMEGLASGVEEQAMNYLSSIKLSDIAKRI